MDDSQNTNGRGTTKIKEILCSINICGLSQRSHFMLDKYVHDNNITVLGVQETGDLHQSRYKQLTNMATYEDTNGQSNKGCALFVRKTAMFTQLTEKQCLLN